MFRNSSPDGSDAADDCPTGPGSNPQRAIERSVYRPAASSRLFGLAGTTAMLAAISACFLVTVTRFVVPEGPSTLTVVNLAPPASPPEAPPHEKEAPRPVEEAHTPPEPRRVEPVVLADPHIPVWQAPAPAPVPEAAAIPDQAASKTPLTQPAPEAPQVASNAPDTWKGRVLAQLFAHRRYPRLAMSLRQQGVPWIRFVMDREGKVRSVALERSSGFQQLDEEALKLPRRAQPLPAPPADVTGNTIELVVPVEFFLNGR